MGFDGYGEEKFVERKFDYFDVGIDLRVWFVGGGGYSRGVSDTCSERASVLCGESDKDVWLGWVQWLLLFFFFYNYSVWFDYRLYIITGSFFPQLLSCNQRPWFSHFCFIHLIHHSYLIIFFFHTTYLSLIRN